MFKTELHCHSADISQCARVNVDTIIKRYTDGGYSSIVLTNHFNSGTSNSLNCKTWDEFVDKYIAGYEKLKSAAYGKLNVLLGMELRFDENCNDYLVFGIDEKFLRENEYIYRSNPREFHKLAQKNGLLFIQAHPFRHGMTIIDPSCLDGVEIFNGHMGHNSSNDIANIWAEKYSLIKTSGTDFHYADVPTNAGILTDIEIVDEKQLVDILKSGNYTLIKD